MINKRKCLMQSWHFFPWASNRSKRRRLFGKFSPDAKTEDINMEELVRRALKLLA